MKYAYEGEYREFRGYVFWRGKPVTITDQGTVEALEKEPHFRRIEDEEVQRQDAKEDAAEEVLIQERPILHKRGWPLGKSRK